MLRNVQPLTHLYNGAVLNHNFLLSARATRKHNFSE